jgi:hypothetical protein
LGLNEAAFPALHARMGATLTEASSGLDLPALRHLGVKFIGVEALRWWLWHHADLA